VPAPAAILVGPRPLDPVDKLRHHRTLWRPGQTAARKRFRGRCSPPGFQHVHASQQRRPRSVRSRTWPNGTTVGGSPTPASPPGEHLPGLVRAWRSRHPRRRGNLGLVRGNPDPVRPSLGRRDCPTRPAPHRLAPRGPPSEASAVSRQSPQSPQSPAVAEASESPRREVQVEPAAPGCPPSPSAPVAAGEVRRLGRLRVGLVCRA